MARFPVATGITAANPLTPICDTEGIAMGVMLQNASAQDCFVSDDPNTLQNTTPANLPQVGLFFPGNNPAIVVLDSFNGKLYARSQNTGGQMEVIKFKKC